MSVSGNPDAANFALFNFLLTSYFLLGSKIGPFNKVKVFCVVSIPWIKTVSLVATTTSVPLSNTSISSPFFKLDLSIADPNLTVLLSVIWYLALVLYIKEFAKISFQFDFVFLILSPRFLIVIISPSLVLKPSVSSWNLDITPSINNSTFLVVSPPS